MDDLRGRERDAKERREESSSPQYEIPPQPQPPVVSSSSQSYLDTNRMKQERFQRNLYIYFSNNFTFAEEEREEDVGVG